MPRSQFTPPPWFDESNSEEFERDFQVWLEGDERLMEATLSLERVLNFIAAYSRHPRKIEATKKGIEALKKEIAAAQARRRASDEALQRHIAVWDARLKKRSAANNAANQKRDE